MEARSRTAGETALPVVFERIWQGSFPRLATGQVTNRDLFYSSYLQTYLQRDVRDLAQVGDSDAFLRFIRGCAARTGQMVNLSELARDMDVSVKTAGHWLSILIASFQVCLLQPYHNTLTKRLVKTPRLYFLDTGLCAYLTEWSSPETLAAGAMSGAMFETFVYGEILKSWWNRLRSPHVYYYRDKDGKDIDLLFEQDQTLHPLEVKLGATPKRDWVRHFGVLEHFDRPVGEGGVVCLSPQVLPLTAKTNAIPVGVI